MSINRAVVSGNVVADAQLSETRRGTSVLNFSVAVTDRVFNKSTEQFDNRVNFIDVAVFGRRAEGLEHRCVKGQRVVIDGSLRQTSRIDDMGRRLSRVQIVVDDIDFVYPRRDVDEYEDDCEYED
jgi:single-strand DNA-binding protein